MNLALTSLSHKPGVSIGIKNLTRHELQWRSDGCGRIVYKNISKSCLTKPLLGKDKSPYQNQSSFAKMSEGFAESQSTFKKARLPE